MARTIKVRKLLQKRAGERKDAQALVEFALMDAAAHGVVVMQDGKRVTIDRLKFYSE
jgi:hypothetical protein